MSSENQIRITVSSWIADLKGWDKDSHLEIVPITKEDNKPITKDTIFILKEVKKVGKSEPGKLGKKK